MEDMFNSNVATAFIYSTITFYPFLWLLTALLIAAVCFKRNHVVLLKSYVKDKDNEYQLQVEEL